MARKKTTTAKSRSKATKPESTAGAPATPELTIFGSFDSDSGTSEARPIFHSVDFFLDIFEAEDCFTYTLENGLFFAGRDDGFKVIVDVSEQLPFVSLEFPLKIKRGVSKTKVMNWVNECMMELPMLRLFRGEDDILYSTFDYPYHADFEFDVDHFMLTVEMFWQINIGLLEKGKDGIIDPNAFPIDII